MDFSTFWQTGYEYHTGDSAIHTLIGSVPLGNLWLSVHKTWGELLHTLMPCSACESSLVFAVVPEFYNNSKKGSASPYQLSKCDQHISYCHIYRVLVITQERTFMKWIQLSFTFGCFPSYLFTKEFFVTPFPHWPSSFIWNNQHSISQIQVLPDEMTVTYDEV